MSLIFLIDQLKLLQVLRMKISANQKDSIRHQLVLLTVMPKNLTQWVRLKNSMDTSTIKVDLELQDHLSNKE